MTRFYIRQSVRSIYDLVGRDIWDMHNPLPRETGLDATVIAIPATYGVQFIQKNFANTIDNLYINKMLRVFSVDPGPLTDEWTITGAYSYDSRRFGLVRLIVTPTWLRAAGLAAG